MAGLGKRRSGASFGTQRQRTRRVEVAGPYRSQSRDPKVRAQATASEHRKVPVSGPTPIPKVPGITAPLPYVPPVHLAAPSLPPLPSTAYQLALTKGYQPDQAFKDKYGPRITAAVEKARIQHIASKENLKEPEDLTNLALALTGVGDVALLAKGGEFGAKTAATVGAEAAAKSAASSVESKALSRGLARLLGSRGAVRSAAGRAAAKAEPRALTAARQGAVDLAKKAPTPVKVAARTGAKAAAYPVKHPFTAPLSLQAPAALIHGDPSQFLKGAEGKGLYADIAGSLAGAGGHIAPILGEAVNLPATVLPSTYLVGKAGLHAAKGDSAEIKELWKQWKDTGLLPALVTGDISQASSALGHHPLYSGLEASGALAAVGRGLGAVARGVSHDRVGGLTRPDLPVRGTSVNVKRRYSRDLLRQGLQRGYDRSSRGRSAGADTFRGRHLLKEAANRFESNAEAVRREHAQTDVAALKKILPKKGVLRRKLDRKSADVVNLAVERIIRHPETFSQDLVHYKSLLEAAAKELGPDGKPRLNKAEMANNKALRKQIDAGIKRANPEHVVHSANAFIDLQKPILEEMVDLKLLSPSQAANASATSFARVHMGAQHVEGIGKVDRNGQPLSLEQITAEMQRHGIEPPGFLSHRAPTNADFYRPSFGGAILDKGTRTGESVVKGSQVGGIESLVRQIRRSRGLVDRARSWNKAVTRFGIEIKGVKTMADAKRVLQDPQRYGLDPSIQPVAVPRHPFASRKNEIEGALEHQDPATAEEAATGILHDALTEASKGTLEDRTPIVFMPGKVAEQLRANAEPSSLGLKGAQAVTTTFKRAVLPFSPGFYIGNGFDNALRTALAGINPAHFAIGRKVEKALTPEEKVELGAGAHFSSVEALAPHRSVESVIRGYDPVSKGVRAAAEWSHQHGWKQAVVKFGPKLLADSSHYLMATNAYLTEVLPQRGAIGKIALREFRDTQKSWTKALVHQRALAEDFAKGVKNPDKMIQFQKDLEEIYGNYTRMSPAARKVLSTVAPFWTWMRAAYKYVYVTMPVHHSIETAFLVASANATLEEREHYGLDKQGEKPIASFLQGAIPLPNGGVFPTSNYNSFGFASNPLEAANRLIIPQYRNILESLAGRDWRGQEIPGGEGGKVAAAFWDMATSFIPGANLFAKETEGRKEFSPHLNLPHPYDKSYVEYEREPKQTITVPESGGSSGSAPWKSGESSSGTAPWKNPESSSGKAPWK
jgi:hypothetical protein